ncbi:MAG: UDP-glucose 4-epimerase GalE [Candidatus Bipolaricaulota bacterium]|nr:UDP-glucose 4-epimerase GalE [Candidatus Bipolaricaulota bacterium]MDW8126732.1 UDP-glucose 4-epimerase GalE [Candidatus Bipolaricaulota bacterium]
MILVTGGAGYIGSHTVKELLRAGYEVVVVDDLSSGHRQFVLTKHFVRADIRNRQALREVFERHPIEAVMHFAALTSVPESVADPGRYYDVNLLGSLNLLEAMRAFGVKRIVFSSSAAVYGDPEKIPIPEDHPTRPKSPYGKSKLMFEEILADYAQAYGFFFVSLRYFNAAGSDPEGEIGEWHEPERHLIPIVLEVALGKRPYVEIFGTDYATPDGTGVRDYIHVVDLARAHVLALKRLERGGESKVYNLGIGRGYSVREVIAVCRKVTGRKIPVQEGPRRPGDPAVLVADPTRAQKELGWKPQYTTLEPIVETAWQWMLKISSKTFKCP